jgi:tetratricopeptide (TPR) repeat protein
MGEHMSNIVHKSRGSFELAAIAFGVVVIALGVYLFKNIQGWDTPARSVFDGNQTVYAAMTDDEYGALVKDRSRLEGENTALKAQISQFENEKNAIITQMRTSVKAFDDYRNQMSAQVQQLNNQVSQLQEHNQSLASRAQVAASPVVASADGGELMGKIKDLQDEINVYKETISLMRQEIDSKQDEKILVEAGKLHYNVANFYFRNKQYKDAVNEYSKALMYQPDDADIHYNLAIVSDEYLGDRQLALSHYKRYLALTPNAELALDVEERILDLELYETVLSVDQNTATPSKVRWLDQKYKPNVSEFHSG